MSKKVYTDLDFQNELKIINYPAPTNAGDLATKGFVESVASSGFSKRVIPSLEVLTIPAEQQMLVKRQIKIYGQIKLSGQLVIL